MNHSLIVKERQTNDELQETRKKLEDVEAMNQTLLVKERQSNDELQEARKELINVYISDRALIRVKRLGEIDPKPFQDACKKKYSANEADIKACQLCYDWQNKLKDPNWLPFVNVKVGENLYKTNIDENDVKLSSLRNDMGEDVFKAVANALLELKEYAGSGKFPDPELWNFKEGRRATLKEGIQRLCQLMPKK
ncbi:hypothetical protein MKX03_013753 [Papaver bracteatum]|nr:hypothetical protein MKX03_013753 [Papaver bracteatum]